MANVISKALSDIKFRIPASILKETFLPTRGIGGFQTFTPLSLDFRIRQAVIDARVIPDCNLVGGSEVLIYIGDINPEFYENYKMVWRIPLTRTENKQITSALSLVFGVKGLYGTGNNLAPRSAIEDAVNDLLATNRIISQITNADIELVGMNTIMAYGNISPSQDLYLRCRVENDTELNNLPTTAIPHFSKLVEYAVKSYIYNTLILTIDQGFLSGGSELGRFAAVVEGYADAEENYQDYFQNQWRKISYMSDPTAHRRHLRMIVGGRG